MGGRESIALLIVAIVWLSTADVVTVVVVVVPIFATDTISDRAKKDVR